MTSLDSHSLEVISRFKQAVLSKTLPRRSHSLATPNRGNKLAAVSESTFHPKVVDYDGTSHLVLSNDAVERSNHRNKRKWSEFYGPEKRSRRVEEDEEEGDREEYEDNEENDDSDEDGESSEPESPFGNFQLAEILAPLSHPSEIVSHAAILKTYKLNVLGRLARELIDLIEVEQANLNWLNKLLQVLNGEDWFYLLEENLGLDSYDHGLVQEDGREEVPSQAPAQEKEPKQEEPEEAQDEYKRITRTSNSRLAPLLEDVKVTDPFFALPETLRRYEAHQKQYSGEEPNPDELALVQEDLVNYLQVSIQRQHEYIKNLSTIRNGIVKVDRYKQDLHKWGKEMHDKKSS